MSVGPLGGIPGSAAGTPFSQTQGSEPERAQTDSAARTRQVKGQQQAERAAGIGEIHADHQTSDRDADGRQPWKARGNQAGDPGGPQMKRHGSQDSAGTSGTQLDVTA